jgi:hypothetical protein
MHNQLQNFRSHFFLRIGSQNYLSDFYIMLDLTSPTMPGRENEVHPFILSAQGKLGTLARFRTDAEYV